MTMKRYEARREKGNALLEFYMKNNTQYKSLNESVVISKMSQISDKDLNEMTIFHTVEEPQAAARSRKRSEQCATPRDLRRKPQMQTRSFLFIKKEFNLLPMK